MIHQFEYAFILLVFLLCSICIEYRFKLCLYRTWKERLLLTGLFFVIGVAWDTFAVMRDHWSFNAENNLGIYIGVLPLEEYLFMIVVPYFIIVLYALFQKTHLSSQ